MEIGGRRIKVTPESLHGVDRAAAWKTIVERSPNFGDYEKTTDREIPVIRLTPSVSLPEPFPPPQCRTPALAPTTK